MKSHELEVPEMPILVSGEPVALAPNIVSLPCPPQDEDKNERVRCMQILISRFLFLCLI